MSAETLRRAAALMRERATVCVQGPWEARGETAETRGWFVERIGEGDDDAGSEIGATLFPEEAAHIASWHPQVALAVADWLDRAADFYEPPATGSGPATKRITATEWSGRPVDRDLALAVARAYLGEQP